MLLYILKNIRQLKKGDKVRVILAPKGGSKCGVNSFEGYEGTIDVIDCKSILHIPNGFPGGKKVKGCAIIKGENSWLTLAGLNHCKLEKI